jgi:predicted Zn-ribbon and HTH transcriptional regulator
MLLAMPIWYGEKKYISCEIVKPKGRVLADTKKIFDNGNPFLAMHHFIASCIVELSDDNGECIDDQRLIKEITRELKQKAAEKLAIDIMLLYDDNDAVEGVYNCPRCKNIIVCENTLDYDTRDHISDLKVNIFDKEIDCFDINLNETFFIKDKKGEILQEINSISFRHNTINDVIDAYARYGMADKTRMQYLLYVKAMKKINNEDIDNTWRKVWGLYFFEEYDNINDINKIAKEMNKYGIDTKVEKQCNKCGKIFEVNLNTANFFGSALPSDEM